MTVQESRPRTNVMNTSRLWLGTCRWTDRATRLLAVALVVIVFAIVLERRHVTVDHALARLERVPAVDLGHRLERWRMIGIAGDTVTGLWRAPPAHASSSGGGATTTPWVIVMLGGIGTDERAALLVPDSAP